MGFRLLHRFCRRRYCQCVLFPSSLRKRIANRKRLAVQANARTFFAFSRDRGLPDRGLFHKLAPNRIPVYAVWLVCFLSGMFCCNAASPSRS